MAKLVVFTVALTRACYESGPTGFHMARELRALGLDCAVAAVSKMQRPAADARRKNDRRDAEFIACVC